jgi:hypothetical protein
VEVVNPFSDFVSTCVDQDCGADEECLRNADRKAKAPVVAGAFTKADIGAWISSARS